MIGLWLQFLMQSAVVEIVAVGAGDQVRWGWIVSGFSGLKGCVFLYLIFANLCNPREC